MKNVNLDDLTSYKKLDPSDMLRHIHDIPELCRKAWAQAQALELPPDYKNINKIVVLGMGGSAIGGDLLSSLVVNECRVPISVHRGYTPPAFIDDDTLVIASSYSGSTEETLSAFKPLLSTAAKKLVMTFGGQLGQMAKESNIPAFVFDYKSPPRAALPLSFIALIGIVNKLGLISDKSADMAEACAVLSQVNDGINETIPEKSNPAKQMARKLFGNMAVIYGAEHLSEVAARWKIQVNENVKGWAFNAAFPELSHNSATGYEVPVDISRKTRVVMLRSDSLHPRVLLRYGITANILDKSGVKHEIVDATGKSKLAQMMSLILMGDYVSYYLALLYGTDPYPIKAVEYLKAELGKSK
ncbi:MAG: bifunctional phosphoglucose/phosphomannose isomerase [Dehalococcoidia bacterium]|nr:MAG: bifunctional phosphoglucose/phosphomannose isomerase [Dehalococcoidia bacterium]